MENDPIDIAYNSFCSLLDELNNNLTESETEQDTRLKIIDPIFIHVLQWSPHHIHTEEFSGNGFVDYKFSIDGLAKLIVEAKKNTISFGLSNRTTGRFYSLNGPVLSKSPQPRGGIVQAIGYCGYKNAELACLTNGNEWVIFRGSRLGDGTDTLDGKAFIFTSLDEISNNFTLFYDLLSYNEVKKFTFRKHFQEAEGKPIRARVFSKTLRHIHSFRLIERPQLSLDIDRIMVTFFQRLSGDTDDEMLAKCFVITKESQIADERLIRITDELSQKIKNLESEDGSALTELIERVKYTQRNEFVLLVGTKGAGKTTFVDRFFRFILPTSVKENCVVIRINVGESQGDIGTILSWLRKALLNNIENALYGDDHPTYDELQGIFYDEYTRWRRGSQSHLYNRDKQAFKEKFGNYIEQLRNNEPVDYIKRLIRHIVNSRKQIPCLVFDNTDHFSIEFQEKVFQFARAIYETEICIVIVPITDKTSWQLSKHGALQSFENEAFYLPTPLPKTIIEQRINFIKEKILEEQTKAAEQYFLSKGLRVSLQDINAFVFTLQEVFTQTANIATWVGNFANYDIRRCLKLVRSIVSSPYMKIDSLVKVYLAKTPVSISDVDVKRSIIRMGYNVYPTGQNEYVQNLYSISTELETSPLLAVRILRLLRDSKHYDTGGYDDFITIKQISDYMQAIGVERRATTLCLDSLLKSGLCFSYDPTLTDIAKVQKIQLSPSGHQHLLWSTWDEVYICSMLMITPINDEDFYLKMVSVNTGNSFLDIFTQATIFIDYLINEDSLYIDKADHPAYDGQKKVVKSLLKKRSIIFEQISK